MTMHCDRWGGESHSTSHRPAEDARCRGDDRASGGGPLGVEAVKEVTVGVTNLEAARGLWQKLLDPAPLSGPDMRIVAARDGVPSGGGSTRS